MGAASEHRYQAMVDRVSRESIRNVQNKNDAKAMFWRDIMTDGHVLTFRHEPTGKTFTAGKYQTAVSQYERFALLWSGAIPYRMRDWYASQAWDIALRIIQNVGRQLPIMVDGEKTT